MTKEKSTSKGFQRIEGMLEGCGFVHRNEHNIILAIYPVIYGFRVRGWHEGSMMVNMDWCAGDNLTQIEFLWSIARHIMHDRETFKGVPNFSDIKPALKDFHFIKEIVHLATLNGPIDRSLPLPTPEDLNKIRLQSLLMPLEIER